MINESEEWVNKIVVGMEESLERDGIRSLKNRIFFYDESDCQNMNITQEQLDIALKKSLALGVIEDCQHNGRMGYQLTVEGRARARFCMLRSNDNVSGYPMSVTGDNNIIQVGNNNVQNISNVFKFLVEQIDKSNATSEEKLSAKENLKKFIEHPLVNTILGSALGTASGALTSLL